MINSNDEAKFLLTGLVEFLNRTSRWDEVSALGLSDAQSHLWNVLTALRGPDSGDDMLKNVSTSPLRGALGLEFRRNYLVSNNRPLTSEEIREVAGLTPPLAHFLWHYHHGLESLASLGIYKMEKP